MKVLLLNPPADKMYLRDNYCSFSSKADYYWPPIDLLNLSGTLSLKHKVEVLDAIVTGTGFSEAISRVMESKAEAVVFVTGLASWQKDIELIKKLKEKKNDLVTLASGGFLLTKGKDILEHHPCLDAVLLDFTTSDILRFLAGQYEQIENMIFRLNGKIVKAREAMATPYLIPVPRHELFPLNDYRISTFTGERFSSITTSIGCPYNCAFCIYSATRFNYREVDNVLEELKYINSLGIGNVTFVDPDFSFSRPRTAAICNALSNNGLRIKWSCNSRVSDLDEQLLKLMKGSGCTAIQFGLETANDNTLNNYRKKTDTQTAREIIMLCSKIGISSLGYFIIGLPGEDEKNILQTIRFAKSLPLDYASFSTATPRIGTDMWRECLAKGWIKDGEQPFDMSGEPFIETELLSREKVAALKKRAYREFYLRTAYISRRLRDRRTIRHLPSLLKDAFELLRKNI